MDQSRRYTLAKKVTLLGAITNILLGLMKLIGGMLVQSHALMADGLHSFADLLSDSMVLIISKYSSHDADVDHPYGHQRIETAGTLMISLVLVMAGFGIVWDSMDHVLNHQEVIPGWLALTIGVVSLLTNEAMFHYTYYIGKRIKSDLIISNAWHRRSDAASSLVVLVGLVGSMFNIPHLDITAAILVGLMIIKMGWDYGWNSVKQLVDSGVDSKLLAQIEDTIRNVDGVKTIHLLRSRMMGQAVFVDVHIIVSPMISVSEGHFIASHVHHTLKKTIPEITDVTVHVDPEDDEIIAPSSNLPNRSILENKFLSALQSEFPNIQRWVIHYLNGSVLIELYCTENTKQLNQLKQRIHEIVAARQETISIELFIKTPLF